MMKILIPVLGFGRAGGYRVLSKFADELIMQGHVVEFLCADITLPYYPTRAPVNWIDKNKIISKELGNPKSKINAFIIQQLLTSGLKQIEANFDVIIANHSFTLYPIIRNKLLFKTLYYIQAYEPDYYHSIPGKRFKLLAFLSKITYFFRVFTVVNAFVYKNYKLINSNRVLYPGIDLKLFYPNKTIFEKRNIIIGTIGRNEIFKGTQQVVDAFKLLKMKYENIELHIAFGDSKFESIAGVKCIYPNGDESLAAYYRSLDYYISAQYSQPGAFHYPAAESLASGVSLIATGSYPANNSNAWIIEKGNVNDIVEKMENAISNTTERTKKIDKGLIDVEEFDWKKAGLRLEKYLYELLGSQ